MRQLKIAILLLGILELGACHSRAKTVPVDPPQNVSSGSTLTLNQTIVIPDGSTGVHFQDTQLVEIASIQPNYAYCKFELNDPAGPARNIEPQAFTVASVDYDQESIGSLGEAVSSTRMNLQSGQQAAAYHMTCMLPAGPDSARFVTVYEINGALGNYFTLMRVY
ncbi:MAG TPA: hypothetical protein VLV32_10965 [Burkholderiales bacterium]|nr:hypothetical protein [Burkholderiales bacterium]